MLYQELTDESSYAGSGVSKDKRGQWVQDHRYFVRFRRLDAIQDWLELVFFRIRIDWAVVMILPDVIVIKLFFPFVTDEEDKFVYGLSNLN